MSSAKAGLPLVDRIPMVSFGITSPLLRLLTFLSCYSVQYLNQVFSGHELDTLFLNTAVSIIFPKEISLSHRLFHAHRCWFSYPIHSSSSTCVLHHLTRRHSFALCHVLIGS